MPACVGAATYFAEIQALAKLGPPKTVEITLDGFRGRKTGGFNAAENASKKFLNSGVYLKQVRLHNRREQ
jgi:hypothetical protein